jgi:DELLA protein
VIATRLDDVKPGMVELGGGGEAVAVNSMLQLHRLLGDDRDGSPSPSCGPIDEVLGLIRALGPTVVTVAEQEARHNAPRLMDRFVEALHYYCTMFDSVEAAALLAGGGPAAAAAAAEEYLGREIGNIVACEGAARVERHEPLPNWRQRLAAAGFMPWPLGSDAFRQAVLLLELLSPVAGGGYTLAETDGCLTLGWHGRPLIAVSAWHCA